MSLEDRIKALREVVEEDADWKLADALWRSLKEKLGDKAQAACVLASALIVSASECADPGRFLTELIDRLANNPLCKVPS